MIGVAFTSTSHLAHVDGFVLAKTFSFLELLSLCATAPWKVLFKVTCDIEPDWEARVQLSRFILSVTKSLATSALELNPTTLLLGHNRHPFPLSP